MLREARRAKERFGFQLEFPETFVRLGPEALVLGLQEVVYARAPGFQPCAKLPVVSRQLVGEQFLGVCRFDVFEPLLDLFMEEATASRTARYRRR